MIGSRSAPRRISAALVAFVLAAPACTTMRGPAPPESALVDVEFISANGLRFAYLAAGDGPLVILLHGFPDSADSFRDLLPELAAAGYRAVAVFQRGYYPSDIPRNGDYSFRTRGEDVLAIIEQLGGPCAAVIGHDWGASSGYAAATLDPDRVAALIALGLPHQRALRPLSPIQIVRARHVLYFQLPWAARSIRSRNLEYLGTLYRRWSPGWPGPEHQAAVRRDLTREKRLGAAISYYREVTRDLIVPSRRRLARRAIEVPTLLVMGSEDRAVAPGAVRRQCSGVAANCAVEHIARTGHFPHLERPQEWRRILGEYLRSEPVRNALRRCH